MYVMSDKELSLHFQFNSNMDVASGVIFNVELFNDISPVKVSEIFQ